MPFIEPLLKTNQFWIRSCAPLSKHLLEVSPPLASSEKRQMSPKFLVSYRWGFGQGVCGKVIQLGRGFSGDLCPASANKARDCELVPADSGSGDLFLLTLFRSTSIQPIWTPAAGSFFSPWGPPLTSRALAVRCSTPRTTRSASAREGLAAARSRGGRAAACRAARRMEAGPGPPVKMWVKKG